MEITKEHVDAVLSEVEQEMSKAFESMSKNEEEIEETVEATQKVEESLEKSEDQESEEENYETIEELYASMEKSEAEAHYNAIKSVMFGNAEEVAEEELGKSEEKQEEENKEVEMLKSENEELKKSYDELNTLVQQLMNSTKKAAPSGKAITSSNYIAKSEETEQEEIDLSSLSKSEISSKLKSLDYSTLEKSDRQAINEYYLENGSVDKIKHLITK